MIGYKKVNIRLLFLFVILISILTGCSSAKSQDLVTKEEFNNLEKRLNALEQKQGSETIKKEVNPNLEEYGVDVIQVGGEGSTLTQKTAYNTIGDYGYLDSDVYAITSFNGPADVMWVSCATGYVISSHESPSNNKILPTSDETNFGIIIENKMQNKSRITCKKSI